MKLNLILIAFVFFAVINLSAKNCIILKEKNKALAIKQESIWKTEYKDEFVLIQSKTTVYDNPSDGIKHERIVFKYTNLTKQDISISFNRNLFYNGVCYGCNQPERRYTVQLKATEVKEYSSKNTESEYFIFSKDLQGFITKTLDSFHIVNLEKK